MAVRSSGGGDGNDEAVVGGEEGLGLAVNSPGRLPGAAAVGPAMGATDPLDVPQRARAARMDVMLREWPAQPTGSLMVDHRSVALVTADQAPLLAQPFFAGGDPGPIVGALAHVPEALEAAMPFLGTVLGPTSIDLRTKEIVILRTSARASCRYCVESHTVVALDAGLSTDEVRGLREEVPVEVAFPAEDDRALIAWCDAVVAIGPVDPACRTRFQQGRPDHVVVELTLLASTTLLLNRFCTALELPTSPEVLTRLAVLGMTS